MLTIKSISSVKFAPIALAAAFALHAPVSQAATATTSMGVVAVIVQTCIAAATPIVFGDYSTTQLDNTGVITVTCTPDVASYNVALGAGAALGATTSTRKLTALAGTSTLNYSLYRDSSRTQNWGEAQGSDTQSSSLATTDLGVIKTFTVYGRLQGNQFSPAGAYADTVQVTVNY